jgi:chitinase
VNWSGGNASGGGTVTNPPTTPGTTNWAPNTAYAIDAVVTYNGVRYRCRQAHTSLVGWEPPNVLALWLPI